MKPFKVQRKAGTQPPIFEVIGLDHRIGIAKAEEANWLRDKLNDVFNAGVAFERQRANPPEVATCRVCGCTADDCSGCVERTDDACGWAENDLCTACEPFYEAVRQYVGRLPKRERQFALYTWDYHTAVDKRETMEDPANSLLAMGVRVGRFAMIERDLARIAGELAVQWTPPPKRKARRAVGGGAR